MLTNFNVQSVQAQSTCSFDHAVEYPGVIAGLWDASTEYQGKIKHGVCVLVIVKDNDNKICFRTLFVCLEGYVLGGRAKYCQLMQGLLRTSATDEELQKKVLQAGLGEISKIVGLPVLARMSVREKDGKSWASIEALSGETARMKGLEVPKAEELKPVDIVKVAGKFVTISNPNDCEVIPTLCVLGRADNPNTEDLTPIFRGGDVEGAMF